MADSNQRSIKNILINRPLQREFTFVLLAVMAVTGLLVAAMIHTTLFDAVQSAPKVMTRQTFEQTLSGIRYTLLWEAVIIIFAAVIVTGFLGILLLHRVAGPIYRFGRMLQRICDGEIPNEMTLRSRDFFKETAVDMNGLIRYLKQRDAALEEIEAMLVDTGSGLSGEAAEKVQHVRGAIRGLRKGNQN